MKNLKRLDKLRINVPGLIFEDLDPEKEGFFKCVLVEIIIL